MGDEVMNLILVSDWKVSIKISKTIEINELDRREIIFVFIETSVFLEIITEKRINQKLMRHFMFTSLSDSHFDTTIVYNSQHSQNDYLFFLSWHSISVMACIMNFILNGPQTQHSEYIVWMILYDLSRCK